MANRIGPMDPGAIGKVGNKVDEASTTRRTAGDKTTTGSASRSPVSTNDTVELTSGAKLLERLEKTLASLPDVDSVRVAEVKAAIENGEYEIDADAIAAALIRLERSFGE